MSSVRGTEVPEWGPAEVEAWLRSVDLASFGLVFREAGIDGPTLLQLTFDDLLQNFRNAADPTLKGWIGCKKIIGHTNLFKLHLGQESTLLAADRSFVDGNRSFASSSRPPPSPGPRAYTRAEPLSARKVNSHGSATGSSYGNSSARGSSRGRVAQMKSSYGGLSHRSSSRDALNRSDISYSGRSSGVSFLAMSESGTTFDTRKRSHKGSMALAKRNVSECLFLRGGASPGVCRYNVDLDDPSRRRGGAISRARRFDPPKRLFPERPPPGPQSYAPNFLAMSARPSTSK
ncbi:unnamed protein product [Amoebophrya sp. A25]|nr:unnamed protein product [Amoebophrya sp. A25]|eukprot:GSA25T00015625001.1